MKRLAWLIGFAGLLGSVGYLFVYIVRWQWNRALFSGIAFIAVLLVMGLAATLQRLSRIERRLSEDRGGRGGSIDTELLAELRQTRPQRDHFAWLREQTTQANVFITVLLGGGAVVSGVAWLVGRIAESTTTADREQSLAADMSPLAFPDGGLVPSDRPGLDDAATLLRGPTPGGVR